MRTRTVISLLIIAAIIFALLISAFYFRRHSLQGNDNNLLQKKSPVLVSGKEIPADTFPTKKDSSKKEGVIINENILPTKRKEPLANNLKSSIEKKLDNSDSLTSDVNYPVIPVKKDIVETDAARLKRLQKILAHQKNNMEANYNAGLCEFRLKEYDKAISYFDAILSQVGNVYLAPAKWQKSLTLLAMGNNKKALILLNQLKAGDSEYADSAAIKLNQLK